MPPIHRTVRLRALTGGARFPGPVQWRLNDARNRFKPHCSRAGSELTYNDLRIVWLKMHSMFLKHTIRWILRKGPSIAKVEFQAPNLIRNGLQRHVWSTFDFSKIGSELACNDLRIVWLKMHSVPFKACYSMDVALGQPSRRPSNSKA